MLCYIIIFDVVILHVYTCSIYICLYIAAFARPTGFAAEDAAQGAMLDGSVDGAGYSSKGGAVGGGCSGCG